MAKPLREPPPSSSVARLFDSGAASRALSPVEPGIGKTQPAVSGPTASAPLPTSGQDQTADVTAKREFISASLQPLTQMSVTNANIKRELVLSEATDQTFARLLELYRQATGTRLTASHVARAMLRGIAACMEALEQESPKIGRLRLPSNARGRECERERFEEILAEAFINGIRSAAAYRRRNSR